MCIDFTHINILDFKTLKANKHCGGTLKVHSPKRVISDPIEQKDGNSDCKQPVKKENIDANGETIGIINILHITI